jgi:hypothetical protein
VESSGDDERSSLTFYLPKIAIELTQIEIFNYRLSGDRDDLFSTTTGVLYIMIFQKISTTILLVTALNLVLVGCNRSDAAKNAPAGAGTTATTESSARDQQRLAMRSKIKGVLTPDQVQQLETKIKAGGKMREALAGINLTDTQKSKIKEIYQAGRAERQKSSGEGAQ